MTITNGLYSILTEMVEGGLGHASGVIVLLDGRIVGGDSRFYYTGSYTADSAEVQGAALVGKTSVRIHSRLDLRAPL